MANGNIPEPTPGVPWYNDGRFIIVVLGMLFGFATTTINSCVATNNARDASSHAAIASAQAAAANATSGANATKLDEVKVDASAAKSEATEVKRIAKDQAAEVKGKLETIERKTDAVKSALPPK